MMTMNALLPLLTVLVGPLGGQAAPGCLAAALPTIQTAQTRADSLALADRYEQQPPGSDAACGKLVAGYLIGMTSTAAQDQWKSRQRGTDLLQAGFSANTDEPRIYMAMGMLLYHRQARTDALRTFDRAIDRSASATDPLTKRELALVHYQEGLIHQDYWRDWRSLGRLSSSGGGTWQCGRYDQTGHDNFTSTSNDYTWLIPLDQLCPDVFSSNMADYFQPVAKMKSSELDALEDEFQKAMATDSTYFPPGQALMSEYVYLALWPKAEQLAARLRQAFPDDYRAWVYQGMVDHELGRDSAAGPAFGHAFLTMPDSIASAYENIAPLLLPAQQDWLKSQDSVMRRRATTAYWNSLDPLYFTTVNERKLEQYTRVAEADLLFSSPALQEPGRNSFAGGVWIRYGRPAHMWELQIAGGRVVFWDYGPGPDFSFKRGTAFVSDRPTDEAVQVSNALQQKTPQTYQPTNLFDSTAALGHQIVRGLGARGVPWVLVYAEWPDSASPEAKADLVVFDPQFQPIAQWRGGRPATAGLMVNLKAVPPGSYSLAEEVWDQAYQRLSRFRDTVNTRSLGDSAFAVSDILLASRVQPKGRDRDAVSHADLDITPLYHLDVRRGDPVTLVWETYRLKGETNNGQAAYHVSIVVEDATRRSIPARVLSGVGIGGRREPASKIEYDARRPMHDGTSVAWLQLGTDLTPGPYHIVLTLKDRSSGIALTRERALTIH